MLRQHRHLFLLPLLLLMLHCQATSAQTFIEELFNDNAFRRAQNTISQYRTGRRAQTERGTLTAYGNYLSGYNGYLTAKRTEAGRRAVIQQNIQAGDIRSPVAHLRRYTPSPPVPRTTGFQTGHQSGFMYTSRFYGRGPK